MKRDTGKRGCSAGRGRLAPGADPSGAGRTLGISSSQTPLSRSGRLSVSYRTSSFSHLNAVSFLVFATYETEIPRLARDSLWPLRKKSVLTLHCRLYGEAISAIDRLDRGPWKPVRPAHGRHGSRSRLLERRPQAAGAGQGPPPSARRGGWAFSFTRNQSEAGCFQLVNTTTRSPRSTEPSSGGCCGSAAFWMQLHGGQKPPPRTCPVG